MNWKWIIAAMFGLAIGLSVAPFEHQTVAASVVSANTHFQMQPATVDEAAAQAGTVPVHELFLLDTETGAVWQFQPLAIAFDKGRNETMFVAPKFSRVTVESNK